MIRRERPALAEPIQLPPRAEREPRSHVGPAIPRPFDQDREPPPAPGR